MKTKKFPGVLQAVVAYEATSRRVRDRRNKDKYVEAMEAAGKVLKPLIHKTPEESVAKAKQIFGYLLRNEYDLKVVADRLKAHTAAPKKKAAARRKAPAATEQHQAAA